MDIQNSKIVLTSVIALLLWLLFTRSISSSFPLILLFQMKLSHYLLLTLFHLFHTNFSISNMHRKISQQFPSSSNFAYDKWFQHFEGFAYNTRCFKSWDSLISWLCFTFKNPSWSIYFMRLCINCLCVIVKNIKGHYECGNRGWISKYEVYKWDLLSISYNV